MHFLDALDEPIIETIDSFSGPWFNLDSCACARQTTTSGIYERNQLCPGSGNRATVWQAREWAKDAFSLRQDGKEQPIATFEEIHAGGGQTAEVQGQSGNQAAPVPAQITIIALDMVNTPNLDRTYFMQEFERYLTKSGKFDGPVGVVAIERTGIRVLKGFTKDPRQIMAAIAEHSNSQPTNNTQGTELTRQVSDSTIAESALYGGGIGTELKLREADEALVRFQDRSSRIDVQLTIQQLAQALKGIPGRKSVLLVGSGFKFIDSNTVMRDIGGGSGGQDLKYSVENGAESPQRR